MKIKPTEKRCLNNGFQKIYRFNNDYGASVVKSPFSYGGNRGLWELAVIKFNGDNIFDFQISYETKITDDVLGYLTEEDVEGFLSEIKNL